MKVIGAHRGSGKTTELIKLSAKTGDYIVTKDHRMAHYTAMLAEKLGMHIPYPLTYSEFINRLWSGKGVKGFLIDDAEQLLMQLIPLDRPIHAIAVNIGDLDEKDDDHIHSERTTSWI